MSIRGARYRVAAGRLDRNTLAAVAAALLAALLSMALATAGQAAGFEMFATSSFSTGEKPQSKIWYHAGLYWGIFKGPDGVAFYEKQGSTWVRGAFVDAVLTSGGYADVKWNGTDLFVLVYSSSPKLYKYTYDAGTRAWLLVSGFPVSVPNPSGSETMVLEQDSSGRLWTTAEGGGSINVYYSTSADHRTWSSSPIVLETGVNADDISSIVAFGGNKVGVFWSDQNRDEFGFRVHNDADSPTTWASKEIADSGSGHADDHVNLAFDSQGRVYAISKDDRDEMRVHRRGASGGWTTKTNVLGGSATRGIIMVAETDSKVYVLYTRWGVSPDRIEYRVADIGTLSFGGETIFISSSSSMNNVTGMKQVLPPGSLIAVAENGSKCLYNSFGAPPAGTDPPAAPSNLGATLLAGPQVDLDWTASPSTVDGYNVYRQVDGGGFSKINGPLVGGTSTTDSAPPEGNLCYHVRASKNGVESDASNTACADNTPAPVPPGPPQNLVAQLVDPGSVAAALSLPFDEGSGQQALDQSGNGNHGRLGTSTGTDTADPTWVAGKVGTALQFDGSNDRVEVADAASLDPPGSFTIEAWVRRNASSSTMGLVSKGASGERTCRVRISGSGEVEFLWEAPGGAKREIVSPAVFTDAAWHHVACVYDQAAGQNRIFFDGNLRASGGATGAPATNAKPLVLGAYLSSSLKGFLNGALDQVRLVPSALYAGSFVPPTLPQPADGVAASATGDGATPAAQQVRLTWQAPSGGTAATGYNVYRNVNGGGPVQQNASLVAGTTWTDASLGEGELCYTVTAVSASWLEGSPSNSSCVTVGPPPPPPPGAPVNLTAELQGTPADRTLLQWQPPASGSAAVGYNVYRSLNSAALQKINAALVSGTSFVDSALVGGNLCYKVAAVDAEAREGALSNAACVDYVAPPPPPPGAPLNLTAELASTPGGSTTGAAAWPLDEGSGQTFADATGHGHAGQLGTGPGADTADPTWTTGVTGGALLFDGTNDRCSVPDAVDLRFAGSFTVEAWVKRGATGAAHCIASKGDSQQRNFWVVLDSSNRVDFRWETSGGANHGTTSSAIFTDASWHHVACVWDQAAGQNRIYVDGVLRKSSSDSGTPVTSTDPVYVGGRLSGGSLKDFFRGTVDLVRLSPGAIYAANFTPPTSFGSGPPTTTVQLEWQAPATGTPAGYNVYRQVDGGAFEKINGALVAAASYTDAAPAAGSLCYQVTAVDAVPQEGPPSDPACVNNGPATKLGPMEPSFAASAPALAASPNPFNPTTTLVFRLAVPARVHLAVYDARGRRVATLVDEPRPTGLHSVTWSGRSDAGAVTSSGVYFAVLRAGNVRRQLKLVSSK